MAPKKNKDRPWTGKDKELICQLWPVLHARKKIETFFPGRTKQQVWEFARRLGLKGNRFQGFEEGKEDLQRLHTLGYSDRQIARIMSISHCTVGRWRKKLGLVENFKPGLSHITTKQRQVNAKRQGSMRRTEKWTYKGQHSTLGEQGGSIYYTAYKEEENEFLRAIRSFRFEHHRTPTMLEALRIAKSLGWRKTDGILP